MMDGRKIDRLVDKIRMRRLCHTNEIVLHLSIPRQYGIIYT